MRVIVRYIDPEGVVYRVRPVSNAKKPGIAAAPEALQARRGVRIIDPDEPS